MWYRECRGRGGRHEGLIANVKGGIKQKKEKRKRRDGGRNCQVLNEAALHLALPE